ncbi:SDR family NAD(P)-dependent oxidoreductase [Oricola cellulosilytica]|uniref:SDR family NAD(P)-dependent oxidoreductase n=1 Tax=Oricola cellulosilytica TaxID=1429082 RepID=A0A4R0P9P9_9HYPH|nr:SDR family NAD(P)-dependent oxidoreductase [Oricola cellulosilytica]TCD13889.1 SDR family NAD(P)-dependent oxidoreductase [Oricola cellulosilytica]
MRKTILITGSTDGIGLETAKILAGEGHTVLLHGRSPAKLEAVAKIVAASAGDGRVDTFAADLSRMEHVMTLARDVAERHSRLDVLINNAGVLKTPDPVTEDGLDVRFAVNTLAPSLLTRLLLPLMDATSRVVNVSSAAQAPVDPDALAGRTRLADMDAYAQSKLALTAWSRAMAGRENGGPIFVAVNPGSLLASKMVKEGFGIAGKDLGIGADILTRAALSDEFADANGKYFNNDSGRFASPHPDALDPRKSGEIVRAIESLLPPAPT